MAFVIVNSEASIKAGVQFLLGVGKAAGKIRLPRDMVFVTELHVFLVVSESASRHQDWLNEQAEQNPACGERHKKALESSLCCSARHS